MVLTIDLHKYKNEINFYKDEESNSLYTYFTYEPIPPFCIVNVEDI